MHSSFEIRRSERGATIVLVALALTALLSVVALAVDVGMLLTAKTEAQRTADAGAMAGAGMLIPDPDDEASARAQAERFGEMNAVQGAVDIDPADDVDVDLPNGRVTVRVHRDQVRAGPVETWFARVFGVDLVDVGADATAEVAPASAATCLKPFALWDRFEDRNGNGMFDEGIDFYDPTVTGYGSAFRDPGSTGDDGLGFIADRGRPIVLKGNQKNGDPCCPGTGPSWYYPWAIPEANGSGRGAAAYRWNIANCNPTIVNTGEEYDVEPGNMVGPTVQGVLALIALDPFAVWDTGTQTVVDSDWAPDWAGSPRIGVVPTFSPARQFDPGRKPIEFTNFIAVFFESVSGNGNDQQIHGRILNPTGLGGGSPVAPAAKFVRLIE